jgi:hypothetical protein
MELRILRKAGARLYQNSTFVARNPTLLSPAVIEVGPPDEQRPQRVYRCPTEII